MKPGIDEVRICRTAKTELIIFELPVDLDAPIAPGGNLVHMIVGTKAIKALTE